MAALTIPMQTQTVLGANVQPGQFIRNPNAKKPQIYMVVGGSECPEARIARLLTDEDGRHTRFYAVTPNGHQFAIRLDREYELIGTFTEFTT